MFGWTYRSTSVCFGINLQNDVRFFFLILPVSGRKGPIPTLRFFNNVQNIIWRTHPKAKKKTYVGLKLEFLRLIFTELKKVFYSGFSSITPLMLPGIIQWPLKHAPQWKGVTLCWLFRKCPSCFTRGQWCGKCFHIMTSPGHFISTSGLWLMVLYLGCI